MAGDTPGPMSLRTVHLPLWVVVYRDKATEFGVAAATVIVPTGVGPTVPLFSSEAKAQAYIGERKGWRPAKTSTSTLVVACLRVCKGFGATHVGYDLDDPGAPDGTDAVTGIDAAIINFGGGG